MVFGNSSGSCEIGLVFGFILKMELIGFDNGLGGRGEREMGRIILRFMV